MVYFWTIGVMAAAGAIVYRCLIIANAMDSRSNHGIRIAVWAIAVIALGQILSPLAGRIPSAAEGWLVIAMGMYFAADKRRPLFRRSQEKEDREGVQA